MTRVLDPYRLTKAMPLLALIGAAGLALPAAAQETTDEELEPVWTLVPLQPVDATEFKTTRLSDVITFDRESLNQLSQSDGTLIDVISRPNAGSLLLRGEPRADALCLKTGECEIAEENIGFGITRDFTGTQSGGLDFVLRPRAGVGRAWRAW